MASSDIEKATRPNTLSLVNDHTPRSDSTITSEDQHDSSDPGPPPDGGLTAWTQVAMAHIAAFNTWGYISSFGVFQTHYLQTLDYSTSEISWIGSVQPCRSSESILRKSAQIDHHGSQIYLQVTLHD